MEKHFDTLGDNYDEFLRYSRHSIEGVLNKLHKYIQISKVDVLDIGSGNGRISREIVKRYPNSSVTLLDNSKNLLEIAGKSLKSLNIPTKMLELDLNYLDNIRGEKYDLIICSFILQNVVNLEQFFLNISRLLENNGVGTVLYNDKSDLILQLIHQLCSNFHKVEIERHPSLNDILSLLISKFKILTVYKNEFEFAIEPTIRLVEIVEQKQFSGFSLLNNDDFQKDLNNVKKYFAKTNKVISSSKYAVIIFTK
ncbi:MAG: class I SAM-dependent methyltransferase [Bacteroidales bacterium]|nr:class I SAM-dependent methyltransferase [Bacteroidales bacterium]